MIDSVFNKNTTYSVIGKTILRHDPTPLNYWHIVIDVHAPNSKPPLRNAKSKWRQDVQTNIFENVIRKNISINSSRWEYIPPLFFIYNKFAIITQYPIYNATYAIINSPYNKLNKANKITILAPKSI